MIAASPDSSRQHSRVGSRWRGLIVAGLLVISLAACGTGGSGSEDAEQDAGPSAAPSAKAARGIDTVDWPEDLEGARALFARMPEELAGMRVERYEAADGAGVTYGAGAKSTFAEAAPPDGEIKDPRDNLAVMFAIGMSCEKGYEGTAPEREPGPESGGGPALGQGNRVEGLWWFSCAAAVAEDGRHHAIGWVSGDLAWLAVSPDERTSQALIDAMIKAR